MNRLKLLITIIDRGKGNDVVKLFEESGCHSNYVTYGKGTASEDILEVLGFGIIEKEVVFSIADESLVSDLFQLLEAELDFDRPGKGISFSIPLSSIAGQKALNEILGKKGEK